MPGPRIRQFSPFLLIDHTGPMLVAPTDAPLGTPHPHRGFETVTVVYEGALGPDDVQWMAAGAGLLHEEHHEREFARQGGTLELLQLWVNVPKKDKMDPPRYQNIQAAAIPNVPTADGRGRSRVVASIYKGAAGPADTFSPITLLDVHLPEGTATTLHLPADYNVGIYVVKGSIVLHGNRPATTKQLVVFG